MYKTIVCFRADYKRIWVDSLVVVPDWERTQVVADLAAINPDVFDAHMPKDVKNACTAYYGMGMRVRFNTDMRGPYILDTETEMDEDALIEWAKMNVYVEQRP